MTCARQPVVVGGHPTIVMAGEGPPSTPLSAGPHADAQYRESRLQRRRALTVDIRSSLGDDLPTSDHGWLYDDRTGLPK